MSTAALTVPPLVAGDRLSRDEFLRRWEAHPEIKKAELIGGIVYLMPSPVSIDHGEMDSHVTTWLGVYAAATPGCGTGNNATTFLLEDCAQPDGQLRLLPEAGGTSWVENKFLHGVPELLAEVSLSSTAYDLHQKLDLFREAGVKEYLAVLLYEQEIRWHYLSRKGYQLLTPDSAGIYRSRIFPGLWLHGKALLGGNMAKVLATLQKGMNSDEHVRFVARLNKKLRSTRE